MRLRDGLGAATVSAASIGVGASVGRDGPAVHLAATIASWLSKRFTLSRSMTLTFPGCGVESGVTASFNAPIAGEFFALEVVVGHYGLGALAPVVISSVIGTIIARVHLGDFPAFVVPGAELASYAELPIFILLGVVCAGTSILCMTGCMGLAKLVSRGPIPKMLLPACGGVAVGAIVVFYPQVVGVGYETTDLALNGGFGPDIILLTTLVLAKILASALSLGSGFRGGVFSPSLCIGALSGAAFGLAVATILPRIDVNPNAYSVVRMGVVAGAVLGAPISTFLIIFQLTGDFGLTVAVMLSSAVSSLIVRESIGHSLFTWQLKSHSVDLIRNHERVICQPIPVRELITETFRAVPDDMTVTKLGGLILSVPENKFSTMDQMGALTGLIPFADVKRKILNPETGTSLLAHHLSHYPPAVLHADDNLDRAFRFFASIDIFSLPMIESIESMKLIGVMRSYLTISL